jgi:intracellular septation protein
MKFLFDFFPIILFFIMFKLGESNPDTAQAIVTHTLSGLISGGTISLMQAPVMLATAATMIATTGQIGYLLIRRKKVDAMLWVSFIIIGLFGSATIYFHNDNFIKWKPTVLYWCFAVALFGSQLFLKKNLIRAMMEEQIKLPEPVWQNLNLAWAAFFTVMGVLNLYFAFNFPTSVWVNFKVFGGMGLMLVFVIGQSVYLSKYIEDTP